MVEKIFEYVCNTIHPMIYPIEGYDHSEMVMCYTEKERMRMNYFGLTTETFEEAVSFMKSSYERLENSVVIFAVKFEFGKDVAPDTDDIKRHKNTYGFLVRHSKDIEQYKNSIMATSSVNHKSDFTVNFTDPVTESFKAYELLRRVYNLVEKSHLNDCKLSKYYLEKVDFPRNLGDDIFNLLQSKSEIFRKTTIKRQKRFRKLHKNR